MIRITKTSSRRRNIKLSPRKKMLSQTNEGRENEKQNTDNDDEEEEWIKIKDFKSLKDDG